MFQATSNPIRQPNIMHIARTWANTGEPELTPCVATTPNGAQYRVIGAHYNDRGELVVTVNETFFEDGSKCETKINFYAQHLEQIQFGREIAAAEAAAYKLITEAQRIEAACDRERRDMADEAWTLSVEMQEADVASWPCTCSSDDRAPVCVSCKSRAELAEIPF